MTASATDLLLNSICNDPPLYLNPVAGTDEFDNADVQPRGNVNAGPEPLWTILWYRSGAYSTHHQ